MHAARQVRAAQQVQVEIDKPIGLNFKKANGKGGGLTVTVSTRPLSPPCLDIVWSRLGCAGCSHVGLGADFPLGDDADALRLPLCQNQSLDR